MVLIFFHADKEEDFVRQEILFRDQVEFALECDKPIMIHARSAYPELLNILEPLKEIHGNKTSRKRAFFCRKP